jgi:hypothetical protein
MDEKYQLICQKIDRRLSVGPKVSGIVGGIVSTPVGSYLSGLTYGGQLICQSVLLGLTCKVGIIAGGIGLGWKFGNQWYSTEEVFEEWVKTEHIWREILFHYSPDELPVTDQTNNNSWSQYFRWGWSQSEVDTCPKPALPTEIEIARDLLEARSEIGQLYRFCIYLYVERFNYYTTADFSAMAEYKGVVAVITRFHPKYPSCPKLVNEVVERCVIDDLYPYLYGYYLAENSHLHSDLLPPELSVTSIVTTTDPGDVVAKLPSCILDRASLTFRHLSHQRHPREKISILLKMVNDLSRDLDTQNISLSCDDLLPILLQIVKRNIDILPVADIKMVFDYYGDTMGEQAYLATALLSTVQVRLQQTSSVKNDELVTN